MLVSRVTLAATEFATRVVNQAKNVILRVAQFFGLLTTVSGEVFQLPIRQISTQGVRRKLFRGFSVGGRGFIYGCQQVVWNPQVVLRGHNTSPQAYRTGSPDAHSQFKITLPLRPDAITSKPS